MNIDFAGIEKRIAESRAASEKLGGMLSGKSGEIAINNEQLHSQIEGLGKGAGVLFVITDYTSIGGTDELSRGIRDWFRNRGEAPLGCAGRESFEGLDKECNVLAGNMFFPDDGDKAHRSLGLPARVPLSKMPLVISFVKGDEKLRYITKASVEELHGELDRLTQENGL